MPRKTIGKDTYNNATARRGEDHAAIGRSDSHKVQMPETASAPFVLSSPHSGCEYTKAFRRLSRLDARTLRLSEDCFVDELFGDAPGLGLPLISARFPRAYVDVNREPYELDPAMFTDKLPVFANTRSDRILAGLGTIPRIVSTGLDIYDRKLAFEDEKVRIAEYYLPYHQALSKLLEDAKAAFGWAALIDCHSMPSPQAVQMARVTGLAGSSGSAESGDIPRATAAHKISTGDNDPDIVIGDRFGTSCAAMLSDRMETLFVDLGYRVARNAPYAGGYSTVRYGAPASGSHAIQIEVSRRLYMCERTLKKSRPEFRKVRADIGRVIAELHDLELGSALPLAAE